MEEQDPVVSRDRSIGRAIMGALLIAAGAALLIERLGAMPPHWRDSIWPVLLIGYGLAQLLLTPGQGRGGLFFVLAGAWWLAGLSGWVSLERTWPLLFVALGVSIMYESITGHDGASFPLDRLGRRRRGGAPWLLIAILVGSALSSGIGRRPYVQNDSGDGILRLYSVLGGSNSHMTATRLKGGEVVAIMGGSLLDLRDVTIEPGESVSLDVFVLMGGGTIRVPDTWVIDLQAVPVLGGIRDRRIPTDTRPNADSQPGSSAPGSAPRLIIRGTVMMGGLAIRS